MRTAAVLLCLGLVAAACGDEPAAITSPPTTAAPATTAAPTTTIAPTTTVAAPVAASLHCVIGLAPGASTNVHAAADGASAVLGTLAHDAVNVGATGNTAVDGGGTAWTEIVFGDVAAWVDSHFLTPGACNPDAGAATYAVSGIACGSSLNVRDGLGDGWAILGTLEPDAAGIAGTGVTALDASDRTWVQIVFGGRNAWVAGWFVTPSAVPTVSCGPGPWPWLLTANALGPITLGSNASTLGAVTGLVWNLADTNNDCTWYTTDDDIGVQAISGTIVEIWAMTNIVAITPEGFRVGQTKAQANAAFAGRATTVPGPYAGEVIIIDAPNWIENFTYLLIEDPFDTARIGTIRINDDGGYIEGGCS